MPELQPKRPSESTVVMTQMVLPPDTNAVGSAFGGKVMAWIDVCAAIAAQRHCRQTVVTASMDDLHFHAPIKVGWNVTLRGRVLAAFKTSVEVGVTVEAENPLTGEKHLSTSALLTFVALSPEGDRIPVPPLEPETDAERQAVAHAHERRKERLARKDTAHLWVALMQQP